MLATLTDTFVRVEQRIGAQETKVVHSLDDGQAQSPYGSVDRRRDERENVVDVHQVWMLILDQCLYLPPRLQRKHRVHQNRGFLDRSIVIDLTTIARILDEIMPMTRE